MGMKLDIGHTQVTELVKLVHEGRVALPEFQRDFVWRPDAVCDLLASAARRWPIGSFLIMRTKDRPFQLRPLEQAPPLSDEVDYIVLDGQQRCTSFFHAFTDEASDVVYFLEFPSDWGSFDDEQIHWERKSRFAKKYPTLQAMAESRVIRISMLHDDLEFERWKAHLSSDEEREQAVEFRATEVSGLKEINIPHSALSGDPDLRAVAKIFETINRTGRRLDTFDLLVARLYPYDFLLRDEWERARASHEELDRFQVNGLEILKLIALKKWSTEVAAGLSPSIKGVRQSDVLALDAGTVKADWEAAVDAYAESLHFLRTKCGVIGPGLLPQPSLPLTLAFFMFQDTGNRKGFAEDLERWYWATCFRQTYAQGANTQVLQDVKQLRAWAADEDAVPDVVAQFSISDEQLNEGRRLNEMLVRGILGRQIALGSKDWAEGLLMRESVSSEIHHIFPSDVIANFQEAGLVPKDPILNFAAILPATNKRIRNETPGNVLERADIQPASVQTHGIEEEWLTPSEGEDQADTLQRFLALRLPLIKKLIESAVEGR